MGLYKPETSIEYVGRTQDVKYCDQTPQTFTIGNMSTGIFLKSDLGTLR